MAIPITLNSGQVAVYGDGYYGVTPEGLTLPTNFKLGTIYHIWDGGATYVYGGDVVYWKDGEQVCRIVTEDNLTYTILKHTDLTVEPTPPAPP